MRFFCIPDIVEDHPTYHTKTKSSSRVKRSSSQSAHNHHYANGYSNGQIMGAMPLNRSRSSLGSGGRRLFGERKHSSIGGTGIGQAFGPISGPISAPVSTVSRASSATHRTRVPPPNEPVSEPLAHTPTPAPVPAPASVPPPSRPVYAIPPAVVHRENGPPVRLASVQQQQQQQQRPPPATYHHHPALANNGDERHHDFHPGGAGMITDSDREYSSPNARMRKSRRMSAPLAAALGFVGGNRSDMESGNESGTSKKLRRVSKVTIGPPEGFRHEGHVGVGEVFLPQPPVHDSWNVETWRSEIERPKHSATVSGATTRPRGPRPSSVNPPPSASPPQVDPAASLRYRKRGSMDSAITPRRSTDRERERERTAAILDGAMTEPPLSNRPGTLVPQGRASPTHALVEGEEGGYASANAVPVQTYQSRRSRSRSRSGSNSGSIGRSHQPQPPTIVRTNEPAPPPQAYGQQQQRRGSQSSRTRGGAGHLPGQDSITSLASTHASNPTSQSSHATTATNAGGVITPATSTSLSRSASDKPYHPPQAQHYLHHNAMHYAALQQAQKEAVSPLQLYYKQQEEQQRSRSKHQQSQSLTQVQPQQTPGVSKRHYQSSSYGGGDASLSRGGSSRSGHHSTQHHHQQQPPPNAYNHGYSTVAGANLARAASANAAIAPTFAPSSTSSTATAASMASSSATLTPTPGIHGAMTNNGGPTNTGGIGMNSAASASTTTVTGRKSVPIPRRKPVPQHLPATAEVSPFPSMFVDSSKEGDKPLPIPDELLSRMPTLSAPTKDESVEGKEREVVGIEESGTERENKRWRDKDGKVKKEMVPLLGVPGENARYVTETTKAKWDGNMSEIVDALRDPNATSPI
ncbi:hypothetical protein PIIN_08105 [Serendipita indica DSM 11827]|uniref:CRIB domain-containing protein n=1 Tax=Serendipita indica (strain DSM 11827) TaxID=1109443 RepID=G4TS59_SERID|nr:hypothetical protein PIIN_08105 [Serendipita indica DSM 11827]